MEREERSMSEEPKKMEPQSIKTLPDMAVFVLDQLKTLPTQKHLDTKLEEIQQKTTRIERSTEDNKKAIEQIDSRLKMIESGEPRKDVCITTTGSSDRDQDFDRASRSIRFWPIGGSNQDSISANLDAFLKDALLIKEADLNSIIIEDIRRVPSSSRSKQYDEITATFRDTETRMMILSYARNLSEYTGADGQPTAGMRNKTPNHLQSTHRLLQSYGYDLAQKHGKGTRRLIKFDTIDRTIYLSYKLPSSDIWYNITSAMATKYWERENERYLASFTGTLSPPNAITRARRPRESIATGGNATARGEKAVDK